MLKSRSADDDAVDPARSRMMAAVRQKNTAPEIFVRKLLHALGLRFSLHRRELPGTPDIVLRRHRTVVFVHGCFWHRHADCPRASSPKTRVEFWRAKFDRNVERDSENRTALREMGWRALIVWECETREPSRLRARLRRAFRALRS